MSWYDVSVGPNLAAYNYVRKTAQPGDRRTSSTPSSRPTLHCAYKRATENTVVGERNMGDARLDYDALTYGWFDHFLKGEDNHVLETMPKVRYFTMGCNKWQTSDTWPPQGAQPMTFYLASGGKANTPERRWRAGRRRRPPSDSPDSFTYDPMNPVPSYGGNVCCTGNAVHGRRFRSAQDGSARRHPGLHLRAAEGRHRGERPDRGHALRLVRREGYRLHGEAASTSYPDGTAYNLDETIQRVRYRDGYDKPPVWMEPGKVYKVTLQPMTTSNYFAAGHRIRIEVSSSNFPRFDRNLNTGGNNYDEIKGVVAHNSVHHSKQYPAEVTISVVRGK